MSLTTRNILQLASVLLLVAGSRQQTATPAPLDPDCTARQFGCVLMNTSVPVGQCNSTTGNCTCESPAPLDDCFILNDTANVCQLQKCFSYNQADGTCTRGRRRRVVALCLSIFLINFGAANFYIERYDLAIAQIILGLALCFFQFGSCAVAGSRDGDTTPPCIICCSINSFMSLLILAWWIADLVIFATNKRLDGKYCALY